MNLGEAAVGDVVVVGAAAGVVDATLIRLLEMGLTRGAVVTVTRKALLGGPMEIAVRGTRLVLRKADAARFSVETRDVEKEQK